MNISYTRHSVERMLVNLFCGKVSYLSYLRPKFLGIFSE